MSKLLTLKNALRAAQWGAAQACVDQMPHLLLKEDAKGRTLVGYAAQDGRWEAVSWMLARGASSLHATHGWLRHGERAPEKIEHDLREFCLAAGEPSLVGGESLLEAALQGGRLDVALPLARQRRSGGEAGWRKAWFCAIRRFDPRICSALKDASGGEIWLNWRQELGVAALRHGCLDALAWLLAEGMGWGAADRAGATLLGKAAAANQVEAAVWMLSRGAPVDALDAAGHSPLYYAVAYGGEATAKALIAGGANPELRQGKNGQGASPLRLATKHGARAMRQLLVPPMEHGALQRGVDASSEKAPRRAGRL